MPTKLIVVGIVKAFEDGILDGSVHSFDLTIGPGVVRLGQTVFDPIICAETVEQMAQKPCRRSDAISWWMTELNAVVGQGGAQSIRANESTLSNSPTY